MGILEIALIVLVVFFLFGGGYGYSRRADWGPVPGNLFGLLLLIVLVIFILRIL